MVTDLARGPGNYQITSKIAMTCEIEWPPLLAHVYRLLGAVFNFQWFALPGVACLVCLS